MFVVHTKENGVFNVGGTKAEKMGLFYAFFDTEPYTETVAAGFWHRLVTGQQSVTVCGERRVFRDLVKLDDLNRIEISQPASAIEARSATTPKRGVARKGKSAAPKADAQRAGQ